MPNADLRSRSLAPAVFRASACPRGREHPDRGRRRLDLVSASIAGSTTSSRWRRARASTPRPHGRDAARFPGVLQADHQSARHGHRQPGAAPPPRTTSSASRRPHVDDAARRARTSAPTSPWSRARRAGGATSTGGPAGGGTFDHWTVHAGAAPARGLLRRFRRRELAGFTGILNFETIGGRIIEVHLRMSDQWPDLYGAGWVDAVVRLYATAPGASPTATAATASAWCCSARTGRAIAIRRRALVAQAQAHPGVTSVQITFHEDKDADRHAMPPGGFRLAIVNCLEPAGGPRRPRAAAPPFARRVGRAKSPAVALPQNDTDRRAILPTRRRRGAHNSGDQPWPTSRSTCS